MTEPFQVFGVFEIQRAEAIIRDKHIEQFGVLPGAIWTRSAAMQLLREEAAERHEGEEP